MRRIARNSVILSYLRNIQQAYLRFEDTCGKIHQNSRIHKACASFWQGTKTNFRNSFLGKFTDVDSGMSPAALKGSRCARWIVAQYNFWSQKTQDYFSSSALKGAAETLKEDFTAAPVATGSIVIFIAILTNIFLSILFRKEIGLWGWFMRIVFLGVSFGGLFCNAGWKKIEKGSFVLHCINKKTEQER